MPPPKKEGTAKSADKIHAKKISKTVAGKLKKIELKNEPKDEVPVAGNNELSPVWYTRKQLMKKYLLSKTLLHNCCKEYGLKYSKFGNTVRINETDFQNFLIEHRK